MAKGSSRSDSTGLATGPEWDWFLPAIMSEGSVGQCLDTVLEALTARCDFVTAIKAALTSPNPGEVGASDRLTRLSQKSKLLAETLRDRLGMLSPERSAPWYRTPVANKVGPFAKSLLLEPVFSQDASKDPISMRQATAKAWVTKEVPDPSVLGQSPSLWRTLHQLNFDLERLSSLTGRYVEWRLDELPAIFPAALESRPLRAFLANVRQEILVTKARLEDAYRELRTASEAFWAAQEESHAKGADGSSGQGREGASRRRDSRSAEGRGRHGAGARLLLPQDLVALEFMGFSALPSREELRQRYLKMAKELHPDRHQGCDNGFKELSQAYKRLSEWIALGAAPSSTERGP